MRSSRSKALRIHARALVLVVAFSTGAMPLVAQDPVPLSVDGTGQLAASGGGPGWVSSDGRFVVFRASNLLPEDTTGGQVYLRDRQTDALELISVTPDGNVSDRATAVYFGAGNSRYVSHDGRFVLFRSSADDIVPGSNASNIVQLFLRDRQTQATRMVSVASDGTPANLGVDEFTLDPNGVAVMFRSSATNLDPSSPAGSDTYLHLPNLPPGDSLRTRVACKDVHGTPVMCRDFSLACDGAVFAFRSSAPEVAPEDPPGDDVFAGVPGLASNELLTVDVGDVLVSRHHSAPSISCDGNRVAFRSNVALFVGHEDQANLYVVDWIGGQKYLIQSPFGVSVEAQEVTLSSGGTLIGFTTLRDIDPLDSNALSDVYLVELAADATPPYPVSWQSHYQLTPPNRAVSSPSVSSDGVLVFSTGAFNAPWPDTNGFDHVFARQVRLDVVFISGFE